jgi:hypothetical protein
MTLKFNINDVICINLKSLDEKQIFFITESYRLGFECLVEIKKENYCSKIWCEKGGDWVIAWNTNDRPGEMIVSPKFLPLTKKERKQLENIKPIKTPKMPTDENSLISYQFYLSRGYDIRTKTLDKKLENLLENPTETETIQINLTVDSILDKISETGMKSLTKKEIKFLNDYSKKIN